MNKKKHLDTIEDLRKVIKKHGILKHFSIKRLGVFGSFARCESANDIDLLIEEDLSLDEALQLKTKLELFVDNPLDVMLESWANPIVLHRARKDMQYVEG